MKTIRFLLTAAFISIMAISCTGNGNGDGSDETPKKGKVVLTTDRTAICANGSDAAVFTVTFTEEGGQTTDITDKAEIYFSPSDDLLDGSRFSTTKKGEYSFYAAYGLNISEEVAISALTIIPALPADPQENGTKFRHRMLIVQHTGAECPICPLMMNSLKTLSENEEYNSLYNLVASHAYYDGLNDAAYSPAAKTLSATFNSGAYPELTFNLTNTSTGHNYSDICSQISQLTKDSAHAGIAMAVASADGEIVANVEFKFSEGKKYRVGAWLLEDKVFSTQKGATENWHHTHNNALRAMYGSKQTESIYGAALGNASSGEKVEKLFRFKLDEAWKAENCKVMAFVTEADESGDEYDIVNCAVCKVGENISFDYK